MVGASRLVVFVVSEIASEGELVNSARYAWQSGSWTVDPVAVMLVRAGGGMVCTNTCKLVGRCASCFGTGCRNPSTSAS
eukprot:5022329-Lingulodinium_polyedra.AAC.1